MGREGAKDKAFFVQTLSESSGGLEYENYYTNIRNKKKLIIEFEKKIMELGHCEESVFFAQYCEDLQHEIDILMELFRGKVKEKKTKVIYIPFEIDQAMDYLGFLINQDIYKNAANIRNVMNAIQFDTGITDKDKNQVSYYRNLINYFKKDVENAKPT